MLGKGFKILPLVIGSNFAEFYFGSIWADLLDFGRIDCVDFCQHDSTEPLSQIFELVSRNS